MSLAGCPATLLPKAYDLSGPLPEIFCSFTHGPGPSNAKVVVFFAGPFCKDRSPFE